MRVPAGHQLRLLRSQTGIPQRDTGENIISVLPREPEHESNWRFQILVPRNAHYQLVWAYDLGGTAPTYGPPRNNMCSAGRQVSLSITARRNAYLSSTKQKLAAFGYHGNLDNETFCINDEIASYLQREKSPRFVNQTALTNNFETAYNRVTKRYEFAVGETIELLRLEGIHPETGKELWLELKMVPISGADYNAVLKAMAPPSGPFTMGRTLNSSEYDEE